MDALGALDEILAVYLPGNSEWGPRAYGVPEAPASAEYPYCVWFWSGGGGEQQAPGIDTQRLRMTVKGVCAEDNGIKYPKHVALVMQGALSDLLMDSGSQDVNPRLPSHAGWEVLTVTKDAVVSLDPRLSEGRRSHHRGHVYSFLMQEK